MEVTPDENFPVQTVTWANNDLISAHPEAGF